jgi:hypothetical protein
LNQRLKKENKIEERREEERERERKRERGERERDLSLPLFYDTYLNFLLLRLLTY